MATKMCTLFSPHIFKKFLPIYPRVSAKYSSTVEKNETADHDAPIDIPNPFEKPKVKCILCKHNIEPDYKNVRMLSQFVSRFTGRIYGRHITALCEIKQFKVEKAIDKAQRAGLMAYYLKDPIYYNDPKLYDPENPIKPHKY